MVGLKRHLETRLRAAEELGADYVVLADEGDPLSEIEKLTRGGADVVVECSGSPDAILLGLKAVRNLGKFVAIGIPPGAVSIPWRELVFKAPILQFHLSSKWTSWERALSLMERGSVRVKPMISTFDLSQWREAFEAAREGRIVKAVLLP